MSERWQLLQADEEERLLFASLAATRARITAPAAPANRFRQVHRITVGPRTWYLKEFHHTQWKNRLRSNLTSPRARLDGEREMRVALALESRGIPIARPIAWGTDGGRSYYLCAAIPGETIARRFAAGQLDRAEARRAARFAGSILATGVQLPDLSADHIYQLHESDTLVVIDLHNGAVTPRTSRRTATRILRRFVKSVRHLHVPRTLALGFAVRLLQAAELSRSQRRAAIERAPPIDTHGRYEVQGRSHAYRHRNPGRTAREFELLRRVWPGRPGELVLDSPAGAGRLGPLLRDEFSARRVGSDRAHAMSREARGSGDNDPLLQADAVALPISDHGTDGVVVFRFLHHVDAKTARTVVAEAARVAERFVVLSFFHPMSVHGIQRRAKERLTGAARTRFAITHGQLQAWLAEHGFAPYAVAAERPYLRDFWVASFVRQSPEA